MLRAYRQPFFDRLPSALGAEVEVFGGVPRGEDAMRAPTPLTEARWRHAPFTQTRRPILVWQHGVTRWLREFDPDVLVAEANARFLSTRPAVRWMRRRGRPVIGWGHGGVARTEAPWLRAARRAFVRSFLRGFDGMIAYSARAKEVYADMGVPTERISVATNSVAGEDAEATLRILEKEPGLRDAWRAAFGLPNARPVVAFVGRLMPQKRVDVLIEAAARFTPTEASFLVVGDGSERPGLEAIARRAPPRVVFTGALAGERLARAFAVADLLVLPGLGGLALQEGMTYGKPVVASSADGSEDDLVRPENGVRFPPGDADALARVLRELARDPARRAAMGAASRRIVRTEFNMDRMIDGWREAIERARPGSISRPTARGDAR